MSVISDALNGKLPSQYKREAVEPDTIVGDSAPAAAAEEDLDLDDIDLNLEDIPEVTDMDPTEDEESDKIINLAATPVVLKEVLGMEAVREFVESDEFYTACGEGFLVEGYRDPMIDGCDISFLESGESFTESKFYQKNTVRLTRASKLNQLFEICVQAVARAKNDAIYFKLAKVQKLRRKFKAILRQRYKSLAMKKAKGYILRLKQSKSATLKKAGENMDSAASGK